MSFLMFEVLYKYLGVITQFYTFLTMKDNMIVVLKLKSYKRKYLFLW